MPDSSEPDGSEQPGPAQPGLQRLWAPDRLAYVQGENRPDSDDEQDCPFCRAISGRAISGQTISGQTISEGEDAADDSSLVVARGEHAYVVLNLYPYNPGHALVCTYRHVASYVDLTAAESHEVADLTQQTIAALMAAFAPHGFNLGMNQGSIGGAGIAAHLHQHVVPRWGGDTNFMPVVAETKVIPASLQDARDALRAAWPARP